MQNAREARAKQMMQTSYVVQFEQDKFRVQSQTDPNKSYIITRTGNGLVCECPDHTTRKADCKHIKIVLNVIMKNRCYQNNTFRIMERAKLKLCKYCDSGRITKNGMRKNKTGTIQIFKCLDCNKQFSENIGFEKMRYNDSIVTGALQMYYSGMSVRDIENHYEMLGIKVDHSSIYDWICKYSTLTSTYLNQIVPRVGNWVRADEVWIKVAGKQKYLFASMDDDTRYWLASDLADTKYQHNADTLLELTKKAIGKTPKQFITDGLPAYQKSSKRIFGKQTRHTRHIHIQKDMNNNKMERLNGEIRDREKVFRGLKKMDTPILEGLKAYYNFTKKHGALKGKTPSESALIEVDGKNKWKTIIQNASLYRQNHS